jgi:hypothetical protein
MFSFHMKLIYPQFNVMLLVIPEVTRYTGSTMSTMPSPEEPPKQPEGVHPDLLGLNGEIANHTGDSAIDGFINMFLALPECRTSNTIGASIVIDTGEAGRNLDLQVVGAHDNAVIAIDRSKPRSSQSHPEYLWLRGSLYVPELGEEDTSWGDKLQAWSNGMLATSGHRFCKTEQGLMMYVASGTFCRDGLLAYSRAHTLNGLRTTEAKAQLARQSMHGSVTLAYTGKRVEPIFVEQAIEFTGRIRNVYQQVGSEYVPLLQFTYKQDAHRNARPE